MDGACGSSIAGGEARGRGGELERSGRGIGGGVSRSGGGGCSGAVSLQAKRMGSVCLGGEVIELRLRDLSAEEGSCFLGDKGGTGDKRAAASLACLFAGGGCASAVAGGREGAADGQKESEVKDKLLLEVNEELTDTQVTCFTASTKGTRLLVQKYKY